MSLDATTFESLKKASLEGIGIYNKLLNSQFFQDARFDWTIDREGNFLRVRKLAEREIEKLESFKAATIAFESNASVKEILGKSIGTEAGMMLLRTPSFILTTIRHFYQNYLTQSDETFFSHFKEVEAFLFQSKLYRSCWTLILNFEYSESRLEFSDTLVIRELTPIELLKGRLKRDSVDNLNYTFAKENYSRFIIEKTLPYEKQTISEERVFSGGPNPDWKSIKKEFRDVLKALRVFKHSDVRFNNVLHSDFKSFYPSGPSKSMQEAVPSRQSLEYLGLDVKDKDRLLSYYTSLLKNEPEFKVPVNRLTYSTDRYELEDRLIDLIIGLESLYKSSGSMHLGLRCGLTLEPNDKSKAKDLYQFIDQMRELRNRVVHGSSLQKDGDDLTKENILKLTAILRTSIQLKLEKPALFPQKASEWNSIYFR